MSRLCVIAAALLLPTALFSVGCGNSAASAADRSFVTEFAREGRAELERAMLAQERGSEAVRRYGAAVVEDYRAANARLGELARAGGVVVPEDMTERQRALQRELAALSGAAFDRLYMASEVSTHRKAIEQCRSSEDAARLDGLRGFARARLPQLRAHLNRAQGMVTRLRMAPAD